MLSTVSDRVFPVTGSRLLNSLPPVVTSAPMLFFFGTASRLSFFLDHFPHHHFLHRVLYTVFSGGLAVLYFRPL